MTEKRKSSFNDFIDPVGKWSTKNFGATKKGNIALYYFAPLVGIGEEIGELSDARIFSQRFDAIADIQIYLADFCSRLGISGVIERSSYDCEPTAISAMYGYLCHLCLKHVQGIRGLEDDDLFIRETKKAVSNLYEAVDGTANLVGVDSFSALTITWNKVQARDWNKNKITASVLADSGRVGCTFDSKGVDKPAGGEGV